MSLVDASYGSDDDDDDVVEEKGDDVRIAATASRPVVRSSSSEDARNAMDSIAPSASSMIEGQSRRGTVPQRVSSHTDSEPQIRLPDVSELLGPSASNLATTSDTHKKRPASNGSGYSLPRAKLQRGNLHPARDNPDTAGGLLTPPQLRGRSNVATEDLDKIFSRRQRRSQKDDQKRVPM